MAHDIEQDPSSHELSIATPFHMAGFLTGLFVCVPSSISCLSTGALGYVLARSAYNDVKVIQQKV